MWKYKFFFLLIFLFFFSLPVLAQEDTAWVRFYNGFQNTSDNATALAVDNSGNVYVTGYSSSGGNPSDYITIEYAPNGDTLWVRRYNGPGNGVDQATALAVDDSGNVYVTGKSGIYPTYYDYNYDYATIKYAPNGDTLWVRRYDGPGKLGPGYYVYEQPNALAVDNSGNVYVTGGSYAITGTEYATIKYAPNGDTLWVRRYQGGFATALTVDDSGNVYVTGTRGSDYATIKYAPNGDTLWVRRYGLGIYYDYATALALDDSGNVYVTGYSSGSSGIYDDYTTTIKYAPNGDTLWVSRYHGPGNSSYDRATALAVDDSGNVYVTGFSGGGITGYDYATIKYAPNGDTLWVRLYNGPGNSSDYASALAVDDSGNVYVTGLTDTDISQYNYNYDYATIKYAPNGDTLWVRRYNGPGYYSDGQATTLAVDDSGNVYVTGSSWGGGIDFDYATIKYAPNGDSLWVRRYNEKVSGGNDIAVALAVDNDSNVYVTGSARNGASRDYITIKYAPNGDTLWVGRYDGPANDSDYAVALAVDNSGNVYVAGTSDGIGTSSDYATIKYSPAGDTLWVRRYNSLGDVGDEAKALAIDDSGNVYVTGTSYLGFATIKYAPNGDSLWVSHYNEVWSVGGDYPVALAVDNSGNVYVAGYSYRGGTGMDYATIKYAPNGDSLWVRLYNSGWDYATALAVDNSGNVYVTGSAATIKYAPNGDSLWVRSYSGVSPVALAVDNSGNVYVTGNSDYDYATIKYAPNGDTQWVRRYNGPGGYSYDQATALAVDNSGNVYVTGNSGAYLNSDYATIKYAPNGDSIWASRYNGPGNGADYTRDLALDGSGNLYVTGYAWNGTSSDYATIKYSHFGCFAKSGDANNDGKVNLADIVFKANYIFKGGPNPVNYCAGDDNGDGSSGTLMDIIYQVNYVFKGGPAPVKSGVCCL